MHDQIPLSQPSDEHLSVGSGDELLHFNKQPLLDALGGLRCADSIEALRQRISTLHAQLNDPAGSLAAAGAGDDVAFYRSRLLGELEQIAASQTLDRALYYVDRLMKGVSEVKTGAINDINLNRWKEYDDIYTDSMWLVDRRDGSGVHTAEYWGNFIPQIPYQMMRRYTKKGDWVIDTFAGRGTTLIEAQRLGRHSVGIELQDGVADIARQLVAAEPNIHGVTSEIITGDCTTVDYAAIMEQYGRRSAQLVLMHPPYFDIIKFSDDQRDLSNASSVDSFLAMMGQAIDRVAPFLDAGRYLALVIGDKYAQGEWIPLGFLTMNEVLRRGFTLKSIVVKNFEATAGKRSQKELWRYRALVGGFYVFKHEYIFVFKKQERGSQNGADRRAKT